MRRCLILLWLLCAANPCGAQTIQAVLNAASYKTAVAPYTWVAIFGTELASSTLAATFVPFPTTLNGVSVTFNGFAAPLSYVSPTQVNALVPVEAATLTGTQTATVPVIVKTAAGTSPSFNITLQSSAPAIYSKDQSGTGAALAFDGNFNVLTAVTGSPIVLYATGLGVTNPAAATMSLGASSEPLNRVATLPSVSIASNSATVAYAGLAPGLHGIYQLNVVANPALGNQILLTEGSYSSPALTLPVAVGTNVANVFGTITPVYPLSTTVPTFSAVPTIATFTISFSILPQATPFAVEATGPGGTAIININPSQGTWQATYTVPTAASRGWNFSTAGFVVTDFFTGLPFPGSIVPASRVDPVAASALSTLPLPNGAGTGANAPWTASGTLPADGHVTFSGTSGPGGNFGAFVDIARGSYSLVYQLYVDNLLAASNHVNFATR